MSSTMRFFCPGCGTAVDVAVPAEQAMTLCARCGTPIWVATGNVPGAIGAPEMPREIDTELGTHIAGLESPGGTGTADAYDSWPHAINISRGSGGEFYAVLALVLPLIAQCILYLGQIESLGVTLAVWLGTVTATAVLLTIDARALGRIDLQGTPREGTAAVFGGVLLLWIILYPAAFFRRRHFGRPNLGWLAIVVAAVFAGWPLAQWCMAIGVLPGGNVPACTSPDVVRMANDILRKSSVGPSITSIHHFEEISHDRGARSRQGKCAIETESGSTTVTFQVRWADPLKRLVEIRLDPFFPPDPPCCTSAEVAETVEDMVKQSMIGAQVKKVHGFSQTGYDQAAKIRRGECTIDAPPVVYRATYRVRLGNQAKGMISVDVDSIQPVQPPLNP